VEYERALKELRALNDRNNKQMAQDDAAALKERIAKWTQFSHQLSNDFASAVGQMLRGQKSFGAAMAEMWNNMVVQFVQMLAKMLVQWIAHKITMVLVHASAEAAETAATTAGGAARSGVSLLESIKSIGRAAAKAAAWAFSGTLEALGGGPWAYPIAAAAAAATFVGVLAFQTLAGAAKGMMVGRDQLVHVHAGEMIVPADITQGMMPAFAAVGAQSLPPSVASGLRAVSGDRGSGGKSYNFGDVNYSPTYHTAPSHAVDANVMAKMVRRRIAKQTGFNP